MKRFVFLLLIPFASFGQKEDASLNDSILRIYNNGIRDTSQADILAHFIYRNNSELNTDTAFYYLDKIYDYSLSSNWAEGLYHAVFKKAHHLGCRSKHNEALKIVTPFLNNKSLSSTNNVSLIVESNLIVSNILYEINNVEYSSERADSIQFYLKSNVDIMDTLSQKTKFHGYVYYYYANNFDKHDNYEAAIKSYHKALSIFKPIKDSIWIGDCYNEIANIYYYQNNYHLSLKYHRIGLEIFTAINDSSRIANSNNNLGNIYKDLKKNKTAIAYYNKSLKMHEILKDTFSISLVYNNLSLPYENLKEYDISLKYLFKSIPLKININDLEGLSQSYSNVANIYIEQKEYKKSISFSEKALKIAQETGKPNNEATALINLGIASGKLENEKDGLLYLSSALKIAQQHKFIPLKKLIYESLYNFYEEQKDYEKALRYHKLFLNIKDSLSATNETQELNSLKSQFELEQKEKEFIALTQQQELSEKAKNEIINQKKKETIYLLIVILAIGSLGGFVFYGFLQKRKANKKLNLQNQEILSSLAYANSMEKLLIQQMNPHFIFNSLTTIQALINSKALKTADKYLRIFAALLRTTLENSRKDQISLEEEIEYLKQYINLQELKLNESLTVNFSYDEDEVADFVYTPPMLVQPFIENAFLHGLKHKTTGDKKLNIHIEVHQDFILWTIEDNGVGRKASAAFQQSHQQKSFGTTITNDRIKWMKNIYKQNFDIQYEDLTPGTKVIIKAPIVS